MAYNKLERTTDDIRFVLSRLLPQVKDPRICQGNLVSITRVDTTGDLRYCKVYLSVLGELNEKEFRTGLKSADQKKPLTIDLRTVVGAPDVRYLRLSGEGLAPCRDGQNWVFRFSNVRVNFTARSGKDN